MIKEDIKIIEKDRDIIKFAKGKYKVTITFDTNDFNARFVRRYKAFCEFHRRNCTTYDCEIVASCLSTYFNTKNPFGMKFSSFRDESDVGKLKRIQVISLVKGSGRLLDIGCGGANYHFLFNFDEVYGIDPFSKAIAAARESNPNGCYIVGSGTDLPFDDNFFNTITCFDVIEHLSPNNTNKLIYCSSKEKVTSWT